MADNKLSRKVVESQIEYIKNGICGGAIKLNDTSKWAVYST